MRGEYIRGDGLVLPNNITRSGATAILAAAFRSTPVGLRIGLCSAVFAPDLNINQLVTPTRGVNGYIEQGLSTGAINWPTPGFLNGVAFIESKPVVFTATGAGFDKPVTRMFLADDLDRVVSLGSPLPAPLVVLPSTPVEQRTFRYRIYLG